MTVTAKRFTMPGGLDSALASADAHNSDKTEPVRSEKAAKSETDAFSKDDKAPLASSKSQLSKPGITFAAQDKLPRLPIPDLESTCKKYIAALDPLQTAREHHDTERAVRDFLRAEGPELQEKLKKYAVGKTSYIEQFCRSTHNQCLAEICICLQREQGTTRI